MLRASLDRTDTLGAWFARSLGGLAGEAAPLFDIPIREAESRARLFWVELSVEGRQMKVVLRLEIVEGGVVSDVREQEVYLGALHPEDFIEPAPRAEALETAHVAFDACRDGLAG